MKRMFTGFITSFVLVLCIGYVKLGFAMEFVKVEHPIAWDYAIRSHHEKHNRWYKAGERVAVIRMILEGVQFDFDQSDLRPDTIPILERNVAKLKTIEFNLINVIGYTDSKGTKEYNQVLSEKRAQAVKDYLVQQGIASGSIMVLGRGESGAVAPNFTPGGKDYPAGRAKNRRAIELQIWTQQKAM